MEMSLLKAFGIIAVVVSHHMNPTPGFFPANSYHIALFLFASGYFYSTTAEENPLPYLRKRLIWLLGVFYLYHLFHAVELYTLWEFGIHMGGIKPIFPQALYYPIQALNSYGLGFAMWFVLQLFLAQFMLLALRILLRAIRMHEWHITAFFFVLALAATTLSEAGYNHTFANIVVLRTAFFMFFLQLGYLYRTKLENRIPLGSTSLVLLALFQAIVVALYQDIAYTVGTMHFYGHTLLPFVMATTGIYLCLHIAKALAPTLHSSHILVRIGNNSFHICAMHMSFGFIVVLLARAYFGITDPITDPMYRYDIYRFWPLYITIGILGPVFMIERLRTLRDRIWPSPPKTPGG
jgi:fucose 4-O-acetylase-like acetyltransferase